MGNIKRIINSLLGFPVSRVLKQKVYNHQAKYPHDEKLFRKEDIARGFNGSDIGKIYFRVLHQGQLELCLIRKITETNKAIIHCYSLSSFQQDVFSLIEPAYLYSSEYTSNVLRNEKEYLFSLEKAINKSLENFYLNVCPHGAYKVALYFDDVFQYFITGNLSKKQAEVKRSELSAKKPQGSLYSYSIVCVDKKSDKMTSLIKSIKNNQPKIDFFDLKMMPLPEKVYIKQEKPNPIYKYDTSDAQDGDECPCINCNGTLHKNREGDCCTCFQSAPCSYCTSGLSCDECLFSTEDA